MERALDYLRRAEAAEEHATRANDLILKQGFEQLADHWRELARQATDLARTEKPNQSLPPQMS